MITDQILHTMPYGPGFLFVDQFIQVDDQGITGHYTYPSSASYFQDHFPGNPIVPGAIMIETMAQIGLVGFGIYLTKAYQTKQQMDFVFTSSEVEFVAKIIPETKIEVTSFKLFFRLGKLKCDIEMREAHSGKRICYGKLAGMIVS